MLNSFSQEGLIVTSEFGQDYNLPSQESSLCQLDKASASSSSLEESQTSTTSSSIEQLFSHATLSCLSADPISSQQSDIHAYFFSHISSVLPSPVEIQPKSTLLGKVRSETGVLSPSSPPPEPYSADMTRSVSFSNNRIRKTVRNKSGTRCLAMARLINLLFCDVKPDWLSDSELSDFPLETKLIELVEITKNDEAGTVLLILKINNKVDQILQYSCSILLLHRNNSLLSHRVDMKSRFRWWSDNSDVIPYLKISSAFLKDEGVVQRKIYLPQISMTNEYLKYLFDHDPRKKFMKEMQRFFQAIADRSLLLRDEVPQRHRFIVQEVEEEFSKNWAEEMEKIKKEQFLTF